MIEKILSILLDEDKAKGIHYLFRYRKHVDFLKTIYTIFGIILQSAKNKKFMR